MNKMLMKNILRDISRTKARFISIMLIIMLGVGFLVGISSTAPSMYAVAEKYYSDSALSDFRLVSTVGFTDEDVEAVRGTYGVANVMPSYFTDVLIEGKEGEVVRLYATPEAYDTCEELNTLTVTEGRLPEKTGEIVVGGGGFKEYSLGDKITFVSPSEESTLSDMLMESEYTVVGFVSSPLYISFERGVTNVGSGKVSDYMMISPENFSVDRYTELYVTGSELRGLSPYSDEYNTASDNLREVLEAEAENRKQAFTEEEILTAQASIDEAYLTLKEETEKAEKELEDAQKKIDEGYAALESELLSAREKLSSAKEKIDKGRAELAAQKAEFEAQIAPYEKTVADAEEKLNSAEAELQAGKDALMQGIYVSAEEAGLTESQMDSIFSGDIPTADDINTLKAYVRLYRYSLNAQLQSARTAVHVLEDSCELLGIDPTTLEEYNGAVAYRDRLQSKVDSVDNFLGTGIKELETAVESLTQAQTEIESARAELETQKAELESKKTEASEKFAVAEAELVAAENQYSAGVSELESMEYSTRQQLSQAQKEADKGRKALDEGYKKALAEIKAAQEKLDSISEPLWYINDRDSNPGFSSYVDNVERVNAVGKVFPVFFMLVAILVCVTTLSRLVEEQRADIGALTTLGYRKKDIIGKYIIYAVSATLVGSVVGIALGVPSIPTVIYAAYKMLYTSMPELTLTLNWGSAVLATIVAVICTSAVAFFTCNALLRHKPATLLRPKAPKPGKRILLERIDFIWSRMSFFAKVTARNIFRYKARFFMTVIGVAGCTALIVSALGLHGSINDVMDKQFGEIFKYDVVIASEEHLHSTLELKEKIKSDNRFDYTALCRQSLVTVSSDSTEASDDTYIAVPENIGEYTQIVSLRERKSGEVISFGNGAIVSEKLSKTLGVSKGDTITVKDGDNTAEFTVDAICENYMYGFVFVSPEVYENAFGTAPEFSLFMCIGNEDSGYSEDAVGNDYLDTEGVLGVSFISSSIQSFNDMISSLNYVILVMIISAAALAFVVLYNLTNINIAERKREISTLKVLGFRNGETSAYIYRENILLTLVGIAAGLVLGVFLLNYIILTVEIDMVMFGREIRVATFLLSALLTAVFAAFVNGVMHMRLKKIDMVESLKSVE